MQLMTSTVCVFSLRGLGLKTWKKTECTMFSLAFHQWSSFFSMCTRLGFSSVKYLLQPTSIITACCQRKKKKQGITTQNYLDPDKECFHMQLSIQTDECLHEADNFCDCRSNLSKPAVVIILRIIILKSYLQITKHCQPDLF